MKGGIAAIVASTLLGATMAHAGEPVGQTPDLGTVGRPLLDMVTHGVTTLSLMPAGGDDYDVLWAAWGDDAGTPRTVQLALLHRAAGATRPIWSMHHEGYSPTITPMDGWNFGTRGVILLQYQRGAASSHADVYGLNAKSVPMVLGSLDGALIEGAQVDGATVIQVYQGADLGKPPACFGWDTDRHGLKGVPCTATAR